jgi:hypothetical protein
MGLHRHYVGRRIARELQIIEQRQKALFHPKPFQAIEFC